MAKGPTSTEVRKAFHVVESYLADREKSILTAMLKCQSNYEGTIGECPMCKRGKEELEQLKSIKVGFATFKP